MAILLMRVCAAAFLCALPVRSASGQQQFVPGVRQPSAALLNDAEAEAKRGTYLFYTQNYRDKHKRRVVLHGSLYGVLHDVGIKGCEVEGKIEIDDLFSGTIRDVPTGNVQDKTEYNIRFQLTHDVAAGLDVMEGRPTQLSRAMFTECQEDASCTFTWLRVRSPQPRLQERIVLNNEITFDGPVSQILVPVSSRQAAEALIRDLQVLSAAQCE